jgi:hypothetical protein
MIKNDYNDDGDDDDDDDYDNNNNNKPPCSANTINLQFLFCSDNLLKCCDKRKPVLMSRKSKLCPQL